MKQGKYISKQPDRPKDYHKAYIVADKLVKVGSTANVEPDNIKHFRKYLYEIAAKKQYDVVTRKIFKTSNMLQITRLN